MREKRAALFIIILGLLFAVAIAGFNIADSILSTTIPQSRFVYPDDLSAVDTACININTAGRVELMELPGIGPTLADRIVKYRRTYGDFLSTEDIVKVYGIGPRTYDKIKYYITVEG